jgi:FkbM family methyltransferase
MLGGGRDPANSESPPRPATGPSDPAVNRRLQAILLAAYRGFGASGLLARGPGRRLFEAAYFGYKRCFEAGPIRALRAHVPAGTTAIDVGANIGFFTMPFAEWVGPRGRVIALEPESVNYRRLTTRIAAARLTDRVLAFNAAAAETSGPMRLTINPHHPGDHKLAPAGAEDGAAIEAHALDDLIAAHPGPRVSLIKIDVQGAELRVIKGALGLIESHRPALLVEIDPTAADEAGTAAAPALLALLAGRGYVFMAWTRRGPGEPLSPEAVVKRAEAAGYLDILCVGASG